MSKKILSLILCLALALSLILPGITVKAAETEGGAASSGLYVDKTAVDKGDGSYTIQLEAYATGSKVITQVSEEIPTDIVLVLDQSGSMYDHMGTVSYSKYGYTRNSYYYERRHNGGSSNLWYPLGDGKYASVSVKLERAATYSEITNYKNYSSNDGATNLYYNRDNLYAKVGTEYQKVTVESDWYSKEFVYTLPSGVEVARSSGNNATPNFIGIEGLYLATVNEAQNKYTYTYTDADGVMQTIGTSTGANINSNITLYQRNVNENAGDRRIEALKNALNLFVDSVNAKAAGADGDITKTEDNVNHRIAVVGFASGGSYGWNDYNYGNTEVFIGSDQYKYGTYAQSVYKTAFQDMDKAAGRTNVSNSINALDADGGTLINLGMEMAQGILNANPVPEGQKRNQVVVVFTDGQPGWEGYDPTTANNAIDIGSSIKAGGVTVYTVGMFSGADASTAGNSNGDDTAKSNWFMQNLSSNDGTVQNPSYYLSAADSATLNSIFQQISDQIESGGSSSSLTEEAVVKDIVAPAFTLPAGATTDSITLETWSCTGKDDSGNYTWSKNDDAMGAKATVTGDNTVDVTGFNFSENWVGTETTASGTTYRGHKLVIKFNVEIRDGFLGGNDVFTNTSAGIYENATADKPIVEFNRPKVDVDIQDVTVIAPDKNVYLLTDVTAAELKAGAEIKCGNVALNPSAENFGLEAWQNEYVNINVTYTDKDGNTLADLKDLTDDNSYTVAVTVSPKTEGAAAEKTGNATGQINVFKPTVTYQDSMIDPGQKPDYETENFKSQEWFHSETNATTVTMSGTEPTLIYTYDPVEGPLNAETYVKVTAAIKKGEVDKDITDHVTFVHADCTCELPEKCTFDPQKGEFLIHMNSFDLVIVKTVDKAELAKDPGQTFIFSITGPNYSQKVVLRGNDDITLTKLPVGTYTVTEDTSWSWRYEVNGSATVTVTAANIQDGVATVTFENVRQNDKLLDGNAFATNVFKAANG